MASKKNPAPETRSLFLGSIDSAPSSATIEVWASTGARCKANTPPPLRKQAEARCALGPQIPDYEGLVGSAISLACFSSACAKNRYHSASCS